MLQPKLADLELLQSMFAIDLTPRIIKSYEMVDFKCYKCDTTGQRIFSEAKKCLKNNDFAFQCSQCLKDKYKARGPEWLAKIRTAAQTPEHKARAVQNGKTRLALKKLGNIQEYWDFDSLDIQNIAGTTEVTGTCKKCGTFETKPLKKLIEAQDHDARGCSNCWEIARKSEIHSENMGQRSKNFWASSSAADARERLSSRAPLLKDAYDKWVVENPDKAFSSKAELEILAWITQDLGLEAHKHRSGGQEIDIFVPEKNIGIEYNGLYWHSEIHKDKTYHKDKSDYFKAQNIRIIHVFGHIWKDRQSQVKSYIKSALGVNKNKIGARKCEVKLTTPDEAREFLNLAHIQGAPVNILAAFGLYSDDILVGLASFGRHHRGGTDIVLNRFACLEDWTISGGLSRLTETALSHFKQDLITWADMSISSGNGYEKSGWILEKYLGPDYFYTDFKKAYSKQSRKKDVVGTPEEVTEHDHAMYDGLFRIYDCGKNRYRFKYVAR